MVKRVVKRDERKEDLDREKIRRGIKRAAERAEVNEDRATELADRVADRIERDEREEKGIRTLLNFGHTIGHAIEAASGYKRYTHGEAIALGILVAAEISMGLRMIDAFSVRRIERLIAKAGLPTTIGRLSLNKLIEAHYRDKNL